LADSHAASTDKGVDAHDVVDGTGNRVGLRLEAEVAKHERGREDHRRRVGDVLAHDVLGDVPASGLEERVLATNVAAGDDTGATNESGSDVADNVT
jgi:hypothetical protein